jgi:hypothetical protein
MDAVKGTLVSRHENSLVPVQNEVILDKRVLAQPVDATPYNHSI